MPRGIYKRAKKQTATPAARVEKINGETALVFSVHTDAVLTLVLDESKRAWSEEDMQRMLRDELAHQLKNGDPDLQFKLIEVRGQL